MEEKEPARKEEKIEELVQQVSRRMPREERRSEKSNLEDEIKSLKRTIYELTKKMESSTTEVKSRRPLESNVTCFNCQEKGHIKSECPKRNRRPFTKTYDKKRSQDQDPKERPFKRRY